MFIAEKEQSLNEILHLLSYLNDLIIKNIEDIDNQYECKINDNIVYLSIHQLLNMIINDYKNVVLKDYYDYLG